MCRRINEIIGPFGLAILSIAIATLISGCGDDDGPTGPSNTAPLTLADTLQQKLDDAVSDPRTPGVSLRVIGDDIDIELHAGVASLDSDDSRTADHRFHAASSGKAFVGVAFAALTREGVLDPDDPITTWLPEEVTDRIASSGSITARMLLQQTSGIVDVLNEMDDGVVAIMMNPFRRWGNADLVEFAYDVPLNFAPGTSYSYSNTNYMLLALILESVTGKTYAQALRDLVFDPIGMDATSTSNYEAITGVVITPYMFDGDVPEEAVEVLEHWEFASGGQWTTVNDLAEFLRAVGETDLVLDDLGRSILLTPSAHHPYGFGLAFADTPAGLMVHHHGLLMGSATYMVYFPESGLAVAMNVNAAAYDEEQVMLADRLFSEIMIAINE